MNKFLILNLMQSQTKFDSELNAWELKVTVKRGDVIRSRGVAFIRKQAGEYLVTLTGEYHKTFMSALASLMPYFVGAFKKLVFSMFSEFDGEVIADAFKKMVSGDYNVVNPSIPRPTKPAYDRGPKKEYLHPLRRAVTEKMGGKYSR